MPPVFLLETGDAVVPSPGASLSLSITRTYHSVALIVRGTGYDVDHLDQPGVGLPLRAHLH